MAPNLTTKPYFRSSIKGCLSLQRLKYVRYWTYKEEREGVSLDSLF
jgi:hypothetical protein